MAACPTVQQCRPARCVGCHSAGSKDGRLIIVGHGTRTREVIEVGRLSVPLTIRRMRCRACGLTFSVGPHGLLPRHGYTLAVIVWAVALAALSGWTSAAVRQVVSINTHYHDSAKYHWSTLRRWRKSLPRHLDASAPRCSYELCVWLGARAPPVVAALPAVVRTVCGAHSAIANDADSMSAITSALTA